MKDRLINSAGRLKKQNETIPCKFRGTAVECPLPDFRADYCKHCGWNPLVEAKRENDVSKYVVKREPSRRLIFTRRWE